MDPQKQLYGLIAVAEEQQKAAAAAIAGLAQERAALARERTALAKAAASMADQAAAVVEASTEAAPTLKEAAGSAVDAALGVGIGELSKKAVGAWEKAAKPALDTLKAATEEAKEASGTLESALSGFKQRAARVVMGLSAGAVAVVGLSAWGMVAWQRHQVASLQQERQALTGEVEQLRANVAALAKKGGRIVMSDCGGRLCVEVSSNQGEGSEKWQAYWRREKSGAGFVIPRGY